MKLFKKSLTVLFLLVALNGASAFGQPFFSFNVWSNDTTERAKDVRQDNELVDKGEEHGNFFDNPLVLAGKPLDYNNFSLQSKGQLTLVKGVEGGKTVEIPFYVYVRRNGKMIRLPEQNISGSSHSAIEISTVLKFAKAGDQLIIEPANNEDWPAKRILKLLDDQCQCKIYY